MMVSFVSDFRCWRRSPVVFAIYSSLIVLLLTNASVGGFQFQRSFVSPSPARTHLDSASQGGIESTTKFSCTTDDTAKGLNQRRIMLQQIAKILTFPTAVTTIIYPPALAAATDTTTTIAHTITDSSVVLNNDESRIQVPLEYIQTLDAYVVHYYLFGERFGAIVDTGSPFLTCPSTCSTWSYKYKWGCYHPERTFDSGFSNTIEGFDNNQGKVVWRKAGFSFDEDLQPQQNLTFGVFGPDLLDGPGGVFFGLIKDTDKWIRPSFLGQTGYKSFCVDLRDNSTLTLSKQAMILDDDYIPLTRDLNRRYKAPVVHYIAKAAGFIVNGLPLKLDDRTPTYVIFDTGLSGMAVSDELYQGRNLQARKNREKSVWGEVRVSFQTKAGDEVELSARKPITTPLGQDTPWTKFKGNLIVLGLAFLDGTSMSIDIDDNKLQLKK
jgi:hypothetical protein